jgi:hypothetical protein
VRKELTLIPWEVVEVDEQGWIVDLTEPRAMAQTPPFSIHARIAPWIRLNWWADGGNGDRYIFAGCLGKAGKMPLRCHVAVT